MEIIKKWKRSEILLAVLLNLIVLGIVFFIFDPYFETNDDSTMAWISEGGTSGYSDRLVYINILYGKLIKALNMWFSGIRWYSVVFFVIMFWAFTTITYIFLKVWKKRSGILFSLVFLSVFAYYTYVSVQFSRVAGLASAAGILLVFFALDKGTEHKAVMIIAGVILALIGSMIRFNVFLMVCAVMCGLGLWKMAEFYRHGGWKALKKIFPYIGVMAFLGVGSLGLEMYDTYSYNAYPEWKNYKEYDNLRSEIIDYGFPSYYENSETYDSLGLNGEDVWFYQNWNFADPEKFNIESMEKILELRPEKKIDGEFFKDFFTVLLPGLFREPAFIYLCAGLLLSCFWFRKNRLIILFSVAVIFAIQFYLFYEGRYLMARVDDSIWLSLCCILFYTRTIKAKELELRPWYICIIILAVLGINGSSLFSNIFKDDDTYLVSKEEELVNRISQDRKHLYCTATLAFGTDHLYSLWNRPPEYILSNVYGLGGWQTNSPLTNEVKENYGVQNLFRECVNNEKIYMIVGDQKDITESYIRRHYDGSASLEPIKEIDGETVYRVINEQWQPEEKPIDSEDSDIIKKLKVKKVSETTYEIEGDLYKKNSNSYDQNIYFKISDKKTGDSIYTLGCKKIVDWTRSLESGLYGSISQEVTLPDTLKDNAEISVILEADGKWYEYSLQIY